MHPESRGAEFAACTIIAKNYLPMARVLTETWHRFHPECPMFVLLLDDPEGFFHPEDEKFVSVPVSELRIYNLNGFLFKYTVLEASTAVKPYFLKYLYREYSLKKLLYLDPDILIIRGLDGLSRELDSSNILLTPHLLSPLPDDTCIPGERDIMKSGAYNLGFLGTRGGEEVDKLLEWWCGKLYHHCLVDIAGNLFVDQRWMDLAPGFFGGVNIIREAGYNMAYWNLHERRLTFDDNGILVNGHDPLYFFHFSGFDADKPSIISKHQTRFEMAEIGETRRIYLDYRDQLIAHGWNETKAWKYGLDFFRNGTKIPPSARRYYWSLGPEATVFGDPYTWLGGDAAPEVPSEPVAGLPVGVNLLGHFESEKGVGEGARSNLRIIQATGLPYAVNNKFDPESRNVERYGGRFAEENPYTANLLTVNADQTIPYARRNPDYLKGHYNIGYWAWELPEFPDQWAPAFGHLNEVWTPSKFACEAISSASPIPVMVVPHSMDPDTNYNPQVNRAEFDIGRDTFVFLFVFDFHSFAERKNPLGLIRAFKKAFADRKDVRLFIKTSHGESNPAELIELQTEGSGSNVTIVDRIYSREEKQRLMMAADCYVSLHRSEGFGLTLAEAMMFGKPTIATGYSGNVDFMTDEDSYLVPYRVVEIRKAHGPYKVGYHWADPDLDHAADVMRHVEQNRESAAAVGARARANVSRLLHPKTIAEPVRKRLEQIGLADRARAQEVVR
jgi:glycosyltransferase involved in cell wall biosynthesis